MFARVLFDCRATYLRAAGIEGRSEPRRCWSFSDIVDFNEVLL